MAETTEQNINKHLNNSELDGIVLENNLAKIAYTLDKGYLSHLDDYGVYTFEAYCKAREIKYETNYTRNFMAIKVTNFIINKDEKVIDCMKNIIGSFSHTADSLGFLVHRKTNCVEVYFLFKKDGEILRDYVNDKTELLQKSFKGNFPGSSVDLIKQDSAINREFSFLDSARHITMLSSVPSDKSEEYISQGIEKLLNGVAPKNDEEEYAVLILAESITQEGIRDIINGFEEMATSITPYAGHQFQSGKNDSETNGEMKSATDTTGISHAVSKTHSVNIGANIGRGITNTGGINNAVTDSESDTKTESISDSEGITNSETESESSTKGHTDTGGGHVDVSGGVIGGGVSYSHSYNRSKTVGTAETIAKSVARTVTKSAARTVGKAIMAGTFSSVAKMLSFGLSGGYGYSWGKIDTDSESKSVTDGTNHNITVGTSESSTYTYKSYQVADLIQNLEANIKRLTESKSTGLWKTATYVFSKDGSISQSVAHYLRGLTQGDESFIEAAKIHDWKEELDKDGHPVPGVFSEIKDYLTHLIHPIFLNEHDVAYNQADNAEIFEEIKKSLQTQGINTDIATLTDLKSAIDNRTAVDLIPVTPTTNISTTELAKIFSLPSHSLPGLSVLECAEFGRNVTTYDDAEGQGKNTITLGTVYHMHREEKLPVCLDADSLASHAFITGSTGSGKSNTVYHIVNEAAKNTETHFLVIEPAKGEYKHVFGNRQDVSVYGTNSSISELLRINPFSFPHGSENPAQNIHILEHLDRLIEIFNVCWPMYAAMPAVLKEAVEKSYEDCGWNLVNSTNEYGADLYPTFTDVTRNIRTIIDSSEYDTENKGAYKGSLITRLKSLTNGINGQIFTTDEIPDEKLFDENVIVDISRVGSNETKSLIMGLLVLKLQEHRMTQGGMNACLRHITVLEEAHNLLKRTSTEQISESANLLGKSVEMLTNAIAEMRTYGEGFIIADQAPALLDMAVIRNTNTKIIMRLPDLEDRELVGRAANLTDNQIDELAKLPCGVAAVYQNEWVQPVLCKVTHFTTGAGQYSYTRPTVPTEETRIADRLEIARLLFSKSAEENRLKDALDRIKVLKCSGTVYVNAKKYVDSSLEKPDMSYLSKIIPWLFPDFVKTIASATTEYPNEDDINIWRTETQLHIERAVRESNIQDVENHLRNYILHCILVHYVGNAMNKPHLLERLNPKYI